MLTSSAGEYYSDEEDADDAQFAAAVNASRGYYGPGESSSSNHESPYVPHYEEGTLVGKGRLRIGTTSAAKVHSNLLVARPQSNQTGLTAEQADYISGYEHQHDLDPSPSPYWLSCISTTARLTAPGYRIEPSHRFSPGAVSSAIYPGHRRDDEEG